MLLLSVLLFILLLLLLLLLLVLFVVLFDNYFYTLIIIFDTALIIFDLNSNKSKERSSILLASDILNDVLVNNFMVDVYNVVRII